MLYLIVTETKRELPRVYIYRDKTQAQLAYRVITMWHGIDRKTLYEEVEGGNTVAVAKEEW